MPPTPRHDSILPFDEPLSFLAFENIGPTDWAQPELPLCQHTPQVAAMLKCHLQPCDSDWSESLLEAAKKPTGEPYSAHIWKPSSSCPFTATRYDVNTASQVAGARRAPQPGKENCDDGTAPPTPLTSSGHLAGQGQQIAIGTVAAPENTAAPVELRESSLAGAELQAVNAMRECGTKDGKSLLRLRAAIIRRKMIEVQELRKTAQPRENAHHRRKLLAECVALCKDVTDQHRTLPRESTRILETHTAAQNTLKKADERTEPLSSHKS